MMKPSKSIKSSKLSLKFANTSKSLAIGDFIENYHQLVSDYVDILWDIDKVPLLVPKEITSSVSTTLSARIQQCASKQACLMSLNRKGFYWLESGFYYDSSGSEPIVPNALKTKSN